MSKAEGLPTIASLARELWPWLVLTLVLVWGIVGFISR